MKIFSHRVLAPRKIILIFLLAIFLPSLIAGYLSLSTFSKRREAVKKILESNLWLSGEAALNSIEGALFDHEKKVLSRENFLYLKQPHKAQQTFLSSSLLLKDIAGELFLLDADFQVIFPEIGREDTSVLQWGKEVLNSQFGRLFQRAEYDEFSQKNYLQAAQLYKKCISSAPSKQLQAIALEGLGRCLLSSKKYDEAYKVYSDLGRNYGSYQNRAAHPFGIIAILQLYEIDRQRSKEANYESVLDLYKQMRDGVWLLKPAVYDFYITEIESILNSAVNEGNSPEIQKSFHELRDQLSPYRQALTFTDLIERRVIPKLREKLFLSGITGKFEPGRLLIPVENDFCLISYTTLAEFQPGETFYGGYCWDLNSLKKELLPEILEDITKDTDLLFQMVDQTGRNILTGKEESISKISLSLSYRQFPLPWRLIVSHREINALERTARREIFFYGVLLTTMAALMLLGAFLIARDISRESETTRLQSEFVHNISHELKTPLTLIRLYGETLQRKEDLSSAEKRKSYEIITKESERLSHLINNVLDFSSIEMGRKEFNFKKGDLSQVVRDTLESYRYHLEKKGFGIHTEIASGLPQINFDGEAIASVLVNLLSNAMKFSPRNKQVSVKLFRDNANAVLQVADKGIGILPGEVSKIFQRFYRVKNKITAETGGSGLGLTLVKYITEAHGGRIQVESEPEKGSVFSVILPLSNPESENTE
jgi:signal transduction histidine kinase/tetratricopeptide (TPR) repeat protein